MRTRELIVRGALVAGLGLLFGLVPDRADARASVGGCAFCSRSCPTNLASFCQTNCGETSESGSETSCSLRSCDGIDGGTYPYRIYCGYSDNS